MLDIVSYDILEKGTSCFDDIEIEIIKLGIKYNRSAKKCSKFKVWKIWKIWKSLVSTIEKYRSPKWDGTMCSQELLSLRAKILNG